MKEIPLGTNGKVALVDDEDYEFITQQKWFCNSRGYAVWHMPGSINSKRPLVFMHVLIVPHPRGMQTDHKNHNKLDNRKCNLRVCTVAQNGANRVISINNTSGCKGVYYHNGTKRWRAVVKINGKRMGAGQYINKEDAINAYQKKAKELFGEFAYFD